MYVCIEKRSRYPLQKGAWRSVAKLDLTEIESQ